MDKETPQAKLLLVDDESKFREVIRSLLEDLLKEEVEIIEASDGESALRKIEANPQIKDILCDVAMSGMSGLGFAEEIKKQRRDDLNIVFWSSNFIDASTSLLLGVYGFGDEKQETKPYARNTRRESKIDEEKLKTILRKHFSHLLKKEFQEEAN